MQRFFTGPRKIVEREALAERLKNRNGKKVVFTNGCFDVLHIGHLRCLQAARSLGDILVVGVNTDSSVKRLKGPDRPINSQESRAELLSGFGCVDYVVFFSEATPSETIAILRPDVCCKGGDYRAEDMPETPVVRSYGGEVVIIPDEVTNAYNFSTTAIIEKAREKTSE
ncbi:MAG: D-glycero-beta-D-manno-heptose 1-phosphate adenylyltransferase [Abditibacteriota bacterium]|nr:D-glycero-beta-D-manno-heptose 1-phosphate adenylyltransferase [Abditibacteriota bacterium]